MPINFKCLGATENIRKRRLEVLAYHLRHATPIEISKALDIPIKTVYNDISLVEKTELHTLTQLMEKDLQISALDLKLRELEGKSREYSADQKNWLGLQSLILKNKELSLKLKGLMSDKVEHSGDVKTILEVRYESTHEKDYPELDE